MCLCVFVRVCVFLYLRNSPEFQRICRFELERSSSTGDLGARRARSGRSYSQTDRYHPLRRNGDPSEYIGNYGERKGQGSGRRGKSVCCLLNSTLEICYFVIQLQNDKLTTYPRRETLRFVKTAWCRRRWRRTCSRWA